jgi:hypothetical protein
MGPSSHFSPFITQELPDFLTPIFERHAQLWATEIEEPTAMLTKKHGTSMSEFSRDLLTAIKDHTTPTPSFALSPRAVDVSKTFTKLNVVLEKQHLKRGSGRMPSNTNMRWNKAKRKQPSKTRCQIHPEHLLQLKPT